MTTPTTSAPAERWDLVGRLERLAEREDRGALAALRRSLGKGPGESPEVARIVQPALADDAPRTRSEAYYLVASLFGLLPHHADTPEDASYARQGFGWSLRAVRWRDGEEDKGVERRFMALLEAPADGLAEHLRHLIKLGMSRDDGLSLDFRRLLRDVLDWNHPDKYIQRQWAAGFWSGGMDGDGAGTGTDADSSDDNTDEDTDDN